MPVSFDGSQAQRLEWVVSNFPSQRSYLTWMEIDSLPVSGSRAIFYKTNSDGSVVDERIAFASTSLQFFTERSITDGTWQYSSAIPTGIVLLCITYDDSSVSNDPTIYINGSSVTVVESTTPSGTLNSNTYWSLGDKPAAGAIVSIVGEMLSFCVYNRILSAAEIADAYNSRLAIPTYRGLVFAPNLAGAAGGVGDGSALSSTNYIIDPISGAQGTPSGSPVLRAETYLTLE